jgi:endo-1,4-beta-xylanase
MRRSPALSSIRTGVDRRRILIGGVAAMASPAISPCALPALTRSLGALAQRSGLLYGAAIEPEAIDSDGAFAGLVRQQCAVLVPENVMKWNALRPRPDVSSFGRADRFMAIAQQQRAAVHGHCLVWHEAMPAWLEPALASGDALNLLTNHVQAIVRRYAGRIRSWDVVNEAVERNDHRPDGLRASPWLRALGPGYLAIAFHCAHAADPAARLALSDYGLEYDDESWMVEKRATMLRLLERLRAEGAPIHALAIQGHLDGARAPAFGDGLRRFLADVAALGLEIYITELDVNDQTVPGSFSERDVVVARSYRAFLEVICEEPAVRMVTTWGISDRYTSKRTMFPRADGVEVRPLPFDSALAAKPAARAIADVFASRVQSSA